MHDTESALPERPAAARSAIITEPIAFSLVELAYSVATEWQAWVIGWPPMHHVSVVFCAFPQRAIV